MQRTSLFHTVNRCSQPLLTILSPRQLHPRFPERPFSGVSPHPVAHVLSFPSVPSSSLTFPSAALRRHLTTDFPVEIRSSLHHALYHLDRLPRSLRPLDALGVVPLEGR
jgi:hypothetical protein